ncbi:hypothetical protein Pcinc_017967 [Petrolisthes cinctipes]|uniref:Uncharacterized protein n=1 Tax=Petrolisthes cinctipes TaxID=88211 RepID=A0AAE1KMZ4_PETCI|nr:hypothetical protein Pcinc_017967 [Petrolisthes cinctipes]
MRWISSSCKRLQLNRRVERVSDAMAGVKEIELVWGCRRGGSVLARTLYHSHPHASSASYSSVPSIFNSHTPCPHLHAGLGCSRRDAEGQSWRYPRKLTVTPVTMWKEAT